MKYQNTTDYMSTENAKYKFDDPVQRTIMAVCLIIVTVLGVSGNALVMFAVALSRRLQTTTNAFVVNLAASDLISCLFVPVHVVVLFGDGLILDGHPLCATTGAVSYITIGASIVNLALIAFNRYFLLTRQRTIYNQVYTSRNIALMICVTWIYVIVVCFLPGWLGFGSFGYSRMYQICTIDTDNPLVIYNDLIRNLLLQLPSLIVIIFCYVSIYVFLRKHGISENVGRHSLRDFLRSNVSKARGEMILVKVTWNMFITVVAYTVCVVPFAVATPIPERNEAVPWLSMLVIINSCVNPLIYGFNHPHFKEILTAIIKGKFKDIPEPTTFAKRILVQYLNASDVQMSDTE